MTFDEKEDLKITFRVGLVIIALIGGILLLVYMIDCHKWNDGKCECGGNWVYEQAIGHRVSTDYIYICDKCGKRHEFLMLR